MVRDGKNRFSTRAAPTPTQSQKGRVSAVAAGTWNTCCGVKSTEQVCDAGRPWSEWHAPKSIVPMRAMPKKHIFFMKVALWFWKRKKITP